MKTVIFLDIDGVLAPKVRPSQYEVIPNLNQTIASEKKDPTISLLPNHLVNQIYHHFDRNSCKMIESLAEEYDASIVLTSSWRLFYSVEQLKAILNIFDLGRFVSGTTEPGIPRYQMIENYIQTNHVDNFIVIDDLNMQRQFPSHFVLAESRFEKKQYEKAHRLLRFQV